MPIGKDEWEEGRVKGTLESRILNFLREGKPNAYSADEIIQTFSMILEWEPSDNLRNKLWKVLISGVRISTVNDALKTLVQEGKVEKRIIKENISELEYYLAT